MVLHHSDSRHINAEHLGEAFGDLDSQRNSLVVSFFHTFIEPVQIAHEPVYLLLAYRLHIGQHHQIADLLHPPLSRPVTDTEFTPDLTVRLTAQSQVVSGILPL